MTTNTPNPASGTPPGGVPELLSVGFQESDHLRTVTTSVEEQFLLDAFGVSIPRGAIPHTLAPYSQELAQQIAQRVCTVIDRTRSAVGDLDLRLLLQDNLTEALHRVDIQTPSGSLLSVNDTIHARRVRAVCEAIRESLPAALMNDVVRYGLPSFIPLEQHLSDHILKLQAVTIQSKRPDGSSVGLCTIEIDTRNEFWRRDHVSAGPPPTTLETAIIAALAHGQTLSSLGIRIVARPPVAEDFRLNNNADVAAILGGKAEGIDLEKRYDVIQMDVGIAPNRVGVTVDTAKLMRYRDSDHTLVASYTDPDTLKDLLIKDSGAKLYITLIPHNAAFSALLCEKIAQRVFEELRDPSAITGPLAVTENTLTTIQSTIAEQHRFFEKMREGSDNHWAAAIATRLVMQHKDLRDVLRVGDAAKTQKSLHEEQQKANLSRAVDALSSLSLDIPFGWDSALLRRTECNEARSHVEPGNSLTIGGQVHDIPTIANAAQQTDALSSARKWIQDREKEVTNVEHECRKVANRLRPLAHAIVAITGTHGGTPGILKLFQAVNYAPVETEFSENISIPTFLREIRDDSSIKLKSTADHDKEVKRLADELKKIETGETFKGAEAQHRVISAELMRYHGLTEDEARRGANVLRARGLLDTDMSQVAERISRNVYEEDPDPSFFKRIGSAAESGMRLDWGGKRDRTMIENVAAACHIPVNSLRQPLWSQVQHYEDLITAYHALRRLKRQSFYDRNSDVPWDVRIREGSRLDHEMREIARALMLQHAKGLLQEYGPSVGLQEGDTERILADPQKPEHERILLGILDAEPTADTAHTLTHVIERAAGRTQPVRRFLSNVLFHKKWGAVTGEYTPEHGGNPLSYRALLYGNETWSLGALSRGAEGAKATWARKAGIAAGAALGFLALGPAAPLGIAIAAGLGGKFLFKPKK